MASRVVLHIGPRKTATTYVQRALQTLVIQGDLDGSIYPIRTRGRVDHNQVPGLIDLARESGGIGLQEDAWRQQDGSDARSLISAVAQAPGEVILSAEAMSVLTLQGAKTVIGALAPAPVDLIITARDLVRVLPSSWQQHMRNGNIESYPDYLDLRAQERANTSYHHELKRGFWRAYRYADLARRWQEAGARSVSVVTVPRSGAATTDVWSRFIDAAHVAALPQHPPDVPDDRANVSLSAAETYALYGFNLAARSQGLGRREVRRVHRQLMRNGWTDRPDRGPRLGLPLTMQAAVADWGNGDRDDLANAACALLGDLDDLTCEIAGVEGVPDPESVARASGAALSLAMTAQASTTDDD